MGDRDGQNNEKSSAFSKKPGLWKDILMAVITLAIIVVVFVYLLPKFASYSDVFRRLGRLSVGQLIILLLATLVSLAFSWTVNQASLPGFRNLQAAQVLLSQNLMASTLPLGGAWSVGMGYAVIHSFGFSVADYSLMLSISMVWNTMAKFALPAAAVLLLVVTGEPSGGMITLALVGLGLLLASIVFICVVLWKRSFAIRLGNGGARAASWFLRLFHKGPVKPWGESLARFRDDIVSVARDRWAPLTILATLYQLSTFWVFLLAIRYSGVSGTGSKGVSWVAALVVFSFSRLISAIPITSGSVGIAEASFTSLLIAAGSPRPEAVAGVLLFRFLTWFMPIPIGLPVYLRWVFKERRKKHDNN